MRVEQLHTQPHRLLELVRQTVDERRVIEVKARLSCLAESGCGGYHLQHAPAETVTLHAGFMPGQA
jgi:hypothetical protein